MTKSLHPRSRPRLPAQRTAGTFLPAIRAPVPLNQGKVECAALNGRDCLWIACPAATRVGRFVLDGAARAERVWGKLRLGAARTPIPDGE